MKSAHRHSPRAAANHLDAENPVERAAVAAALGLRGHLSPREVARLASMASADPDARVRAASLGALTRSGVPHAAVPPWNDASRDANASVRRRAAEVAPSLGSAVTGTRLVALLEDDDPLVAEAAAWALGESPPAPPEVVAALSAAATTHEDPLVRESAVAALGALGDPRGLRAVLAACADRPAIRRRAVLALSPFSGPDVEEALRKALRDRDWQVRQAAEDLVHAGAATDPGDRSGP